VNERLVRFAASAAAVALSLGAFAPARVSPASFATADVAKAKAEGLVVFYTSVDVSVAERLARDFQAKYGIKVQVERTAASASSSASARSTAANLHVVDVVNTSDAANFLVWKSSGWLAAVPARGYCALLAARVSRPRRDLRDLACDALADRVQHLAGQAGGRAQDLGRPARAAVEVQARQGASRVQRQRDDRRLRADEGVRLGYLQKLGAQSVMQVQSSTEPPKVLSRGEQSVMAGGNEYVVFQLQAQGSPLVLVYPREGTPFETSPAAVMKDAPHPNAGAAVLPVHVQQGHAADAGRLRRTALRARGLEGTGESRPDHAHPAVPRRSGRRAQDERRDEGPSMRSTSAPDTRPASPARSPRAWARSRAPRCRHRSRTRQSARW